METKNPYLVLIVIILMAAYVFNHKRHAAQIETEMIENSRIVLEEALSKWESGEPYAAGFSIVPTNLAEKNEVPILKGYEIKQIRKIHRKGNDGSFGGMDGDADVYLKIESKSGDISDVNVTYSLRYNIDTKTCKGYAKP